MKYHLKQASKQGVFFLILSLALFQSCSQKLNQSESPTAPSASEKADSTSKSAAGKGKVVSGISPMIQYFSNGATVTGGTSWFLVNYVPATSRNGTYTMFATSNISTDKFTTLYNHYAFRRVVCGDGDVESLEAAGFNENSLLITLPDGTADECGNVGGLQSGWQQLVDKYKGSVLGYFIDEPSGDIDGETMSGVASYVHTAGSTLWLDDYDTGVISSILYFTFHNCHLADAVMLHWGDHIMCDADNAKATNGWDGIGCYLAQDYNEFQGWFGNSFNTIWTENGFPNGASLVNWLESDAGISNFALFLNPNWSWADVDDFAAYAYQAGFLGSYQVLKQAQYVCEQNNVAFSPGSSGIAGSYYGVLSNGYYTGPVDPSTQGAVLCWMENGWVSLNQYQTVFAK